jgi:hypothetical protein
MVTEAFIRVIRNYDKPFNDKLFLVGGEGGSFS